MFLYDLVTDYIAERDNCSDYNRQLLARIQDFSAFAGNPNVDALAYDVVNRYLRHLIDVRKLSRQTANGYRRAIVTLWLYAADRDQVPYPVTRRIWTIKVSYSPPQAFTTDEVTMLIKAASLQRGILNSGILKRHYWPALIRAAYDTGLRRADLLALPWAACDGQPFSVVEQKTGRVQVRRLSECVCDLIQASGDQQRELALPWANAISRFGDHFRAIRMAARIQYGTFKWLRRTHGSLLGSLGHSSPLTFERFYNDKTINPATITLPPEV